MKNSKSTYIALGVFVCALVAFKFYFKSKPIEIPKYGNYLSCIGHAYDLKVKYTGTLYLLEKGLPEKEENQTELYYNAIFNQNLYSYTNLVEHNPNASLKWSSFGSSNPSMKILKTETIPYPQDIELDYTEGHVSYGFQPEAEAYLKKLLTFKDVKKGEPTRKVTYEVESDVLTCFTEPNPDAFKSLKIYYPYDPYLTYFMVPKSHQMKLANPGRYAEGIYNPCLNPGSISTSDYNPFGYWYFWRPEAKGHSADKVPFDCTLFYQPGKNIELAKVEISENEPRTANYFNFKHFDNLNRPIKISVLVGGIESKIYQELDEEEVKKYVNLFLSDISAAEARKQLPSKYDIHFGKVLVLLYKVKNHLQIHSKDIVSDALSVNVTLRGKLKLSKKDVEIKVSLSPNIPKYKGADIFARNFYNDFLSHDVVIYEGHANSGDIFENGLKMFEENNYASQDKSIGYQIFALYSCSSNYHYRPESFPRIGNPNFKRDILMTGGAYVDSGSNGSLGLIASLDQFLYNESYVPFAFWAKNYKSDNFYILSNH